MCVCVCVCVKLPPRDLNSNPYLPYPTSSYTCEVTTTPRVRGGALSLIQ